MKPSEKQDHESQEDPNDLPIRDEHDEPTRKLWVPRPNDSDDTAR